MGFFFSLFNVFTFFILKSFALHPKFWIPLGTWISGARMFEAPRSSCLERSEPSTGSFSEDGGRKLFLE